MREQTDGHFDATGEGGYITRTVLYASLPPLLFSSPVFPLVLRAVVMHSF